MKLKVLVPLAFKNLFRYKRRTFITAGAIAFGLMTYLLMDSYLVGAKSDSVRNLLWYETADAMASVPGYMGEKNYLPLDKSFLPGDLRERLKSEGVPSAPRVSFGADLVFYRDPFPEDGNVPTKIIAIDTELDTEVFRLKETVWKGRWLEKGESGALIGRRFAEDIGADIGYPLIAVTQTKDGYYQTIDLEIVGILDCENPVINTDGFYVPLDIADSYLEMGGAVTSLNFKLSEGKPGKRRLDQFESIVENAGYEFADWGDQAPDYVDVMAAEQSGSQTVVLLVLIIAAVGITNTMLMAVFERGREVGMMRALGMRDKNIRSLFLWEAAGIGLIGSVLGMVLGTLLNIPFVNSGLNFESVLADGNAGYRSAGILYGAWHLGGYIVTLVMGVGLSVGIALVSVRRLIRLKIVTVLRFD